VIVGCVAVGPTSPAAAQSASDVTYSYDAANRLASVRTAAAFAYDASGELVSNQAAAVGSTTYERDAEGRVLAITHPDGATTRATYDARGNRVTLAYPSGLAVTYVYDALDRVSRVTWAGATVDVQRDAAGRITRLVPSNGVASTLTLDALGRVARVVHASPGHAIADLTIARDAAGNVVRVHGVEPHPRGFTAEVTQVAYDAADQITSRNGAAYRYDADGNLEQVSGAASWLAGYDLENRLVSVSRTGQPALSFAYDAFGRRARRVAGGTIEEFQRDTNGALLSETGASAADYIYLDRSLLAMRRGGQTYFYLFDHLGSTLALTDGAGATIATYGYDVTGRVVARTGSLANRFTSDRSVTRAGRASTSRST
jgi:YD repeat-containing protein